MRVFVAGASGAIGAPLIAALIAKGHSVTGMTQTEDGAKRLRTQGAEAAIVNAFDAVAVEAALRPGFEVVIDELTALPKNPADMSEAAPGDRKLRLEGGGNLHRAALAAGVRRYVQQSSGFFLKAGEGLADESEGLAVDATPGVAASAQTYTELEARVLGAVGMDGVALRYGFFYGPKTWYNPDGASAEQMKRQEVPLIGEGQGVWNWVHIEDAAAATVAALEAEAGVYHVVDDDPSPMRVWLPKFAAFVGAPEPLRVTVEKAREVAGDDAVYYQTKLRGASNAKARRVLGFVPRRLEWL
jgi:nucleoside-diphosphate-sugar epimerase